MRRYLKLYYYFFIISFLQRMEYRFDFLANILRSIGWVIVAIISFNVIFSQIKVIAGWNKEESLVLFSIFMLVDEAWRVLFSANLIRISDYIRLGEFDNILLKPVSTQFLVSLQEVFIFGLPNILLAGGLLIFFLKQTSASWSLVIFLLGIAFIINSIVILYSIMLLVVTSTFWIVQLRAFWDIYDLITDGARYPVTFYQEPLRFIFTFLLPLGVAFTFPAQFLVKGLSWEITVLSFIVGAFLFFISHKFFYFGIKHYNSASG